MLDNPPTDDQLKAELSPDLLAARLMLSGENVNPLSILRWSDSDRQAARLWAEEPEGPKPPAISPGVYQARDFNGMFTYDCRNPFKPINLSYCEQIVTGISSEVLLKMAIFFCTPGAEIEDYYPPDKAIPFRSAAVEKSLAQKLELMVPDIGDPIYLPGRLALVERPRIEEVAGGKDYQTAEYVIMTKHQYHTFMKVPF